MKRRDRRGFTLAELLIVVAIIAILIAIAIPVFTKQLEKSRDATTAANLRSAFAEASNAYITLDSGGNVTDITNSGGEYLVTVKNVAMRSSDDSLGDIEDSLPFDVRPGVVEGGTAKTVVFHFFADDTKPYVTADGAGGAGGAGSTDYHVNSLTGSDNPGTPADIPRTPGGRINITDLFDLGDAVSYDSITISQFDAHYNNYMGEPTDENLLDSGDFHVTGEGEIVLGDGTSSISFMMFSRKITVTIQVPDQNGDTQTATYSGYIQPDFSI